MEYINGFVIGFICFLLGYKYGLKKIKMTEKQHAKELINKFYARATSYSSDRKNQYENAKQCALIAINEILLFISLQIGFYDDEGRKYYENVKKEIENNEHTYK